MKKEDFKVLLEKYHEGKCTAFEEDQIEFFFNQMQRQKNGREFNGHSIYIGMYEKIRKSIALKKKLKFLKKHRTAFQVAASLLILIVCGILFKQFTMPSQVLVTTSLGEKKEVVLPDGTIVILNAASSIEYPSEFGEDKRIVALNGEAFFNVERNVEKPFEVRTEHLTTIVLGTSFNVNAYPESNDIKVSVTSGKVKVHNAKKMNALLIKNQQIKYNYVSGAVIKERNISINDIAWKDNIILLNDQNLEATTKIMEKWFNVTIAIDNDALKSQKITGKFNDPTLREVLESLKFLANIQYEFITETHIKIQTIADEKKT